jgi:hypothetical protein
MPWGGAAQDEAQSATVLQEHDAMPLLLPEPLPLPLLLLLLVLPLFPPLLLLLLLLLLLPGTIHPGPSSPASTGCGCCCALESIGQSPVVVAAPLHPMNAAKATTQAPSALRTPNLITSYLSRGDSWVRPASP